MHLTTFSYYCLSFYQSGLRWPHTLSLCRHFVVTDSFPCQIFDRLLKRINDCSLNFEYLESKYKIQPVWLDAGFYLFYAIFNQLHLKWYLCAK